MHGQVADLFTDQHRTALMFMHDVLYCIAGLEEKKGQGQKQTPGLSAASLCAICFL